MIFVQAEALQEKLERSRKENEALRVMLEVMSSKLSVLQSRVQENKFKVHEMGRNSPFSGSGASYNEVYDPIKKQRIEIPMAKPSQFFFRTDPKDKSPVSILMMFMFVCCFC